MAMDITDKQGLNQAVWETYNLETVRERFRVKSPFGQKADTLDKETRRYLFLCSQTESALSPSPLIDEYWHAMILNTALYGDYCDKAFGRFIHHHTEIPSSTRERRRQFDESYIQTLRTYKKYFGEFVNKEVWPDPENWLPDNYLKPHRIHIETTNHCNLNCTHCYPASSVKNPHHELEEIYRVLEDAKQAKVGKVTLTGGELFTRKDWMSIVQKALDVCDNIYIITNGILVDEKKLKWLMNQRIKRTLKNWANLRNIGRSVEIGLAFSIDGLESNGITRQNASGQPVDYQKIIDKIKLATKYGLHITINTTLTNASSARELSRMYDLVSGLGIDRWQIDNAYLAGRFKNTDVRNPNWLEEAKPGFKYIVEKYLKNFPAVPDWRLEIVGVFRYDSLFFGFAPAASLNEHPCSYHFGSVIVEGGDEVRFCPSLRTLALGRLKNDDLKSIYQNNDEFKDFLSGTIADLPCHQCRYARIFHGGCRANSLAYKGKVWERDPMCCSLSPFVEDQIVPLFPAELQKQFLASLEGPLRPDQPGHPVYANSVNINNNN